MKPSANMKTLAFALFPSICASMACWSSAAVALPQGSTFGSEVAPRAEQPRIDTLERRSARLDATLGKLARVNTVSGGTAVVQLLTGALYLGAGTWLAFDKNEALGSSAFRGFAVTESILIGAWQFALGLHNAAGVTTTDQDRFARFQGDRRAGRLSDVAIAQYEGELYADACLARKQRIATAWMNIGAAAGGAVLVGFAAGSELRGDARGLSYVEGAALILAGTWVGISSATTESNNEREWRRYRSGQPLGNRDSSSGLALRPALGPHMAALGISGAF